MSSDGWPSGTVTFLFTDVEGSTERWRRDEASMAAAMAAHDDTLRSVVADAGGVVFKHTGDGVVAAFASPAGAVDAAIAGQERLGLPVRMGVHTGEAELRDGDYFGTTLNRAARVMDAGHGGQVLLSAATAALVPDVPTTDLGVYALKGLDASESIFQVGDQSFPELRVHRDVVGNLPGEVDAFVGRATEVIEVAELAGAHRIVTLIGVGGTGKTRLALRAADSVRWQFPDGCWLVDLAAVASVEAVPFAFARGLGIDAPDVGDVMEYVAAQIGRQRRLVVVDNCEHVLEAAGDVIEHLVEACPDAHVLATSREPVMVRGERLSAVPSMTSEDGFQLFLERAAAEAPALELDEVQTQAAMELCERLDRLPLAIELVASRLRVQTPVELLAGVDERLRLLVGGRRSRMERHQTMRGTLDWSYDLCDPIEQQVFDRLSVFAAGFQLDAAVRVTGSDKANDGEVADAVLRLVDRSLLARTQSPDGRSQFRLLETMRAYGREHLQAAGISDDVRRRHADWVETVCVGIPAAWHGPDPTTAEATARATLADIATAVDWRIDQRDWPPVVHLLGSTSYVEPRIAQDLALRAWAAAADARETDRLPLMLRVFTHHELLRQGVLKDVVSETTQRALDEIRTGSWRLEVDPDGWLPHIALINSTLTPTEAQDVRDSLAHVGDWPAVQQFAAHSRAARPLAEALGRIDDVLDRLDDLASVLGGPYAAGRAEQTRGGVADANQDIAGAIAHHERALELLPPSYADTIMSRFHNLLAKVLTGRPIGTEDVRAPWQQMRDNGVFAQATNGAYCTGVALVHLGHDDAAQQFFSWFRWLAARWPFGERHMEHENVRRQFPRSAELAEAAEPEEADVEQMIDAALDAADFLDAAERTG